MFGLLPWTLSNIDMQIAYVLGCSKIKRMPSVSESATHQCRHRFSSFEVVEMRHLSQCESADMTRDSEPRAS
jgi:hypothetical protein